MHVWCSNKEDTQMTINFLGSQKKTFIMISDYIGKDTILNKKFSKTLFWASYWYREKLAFNKAWCDPFDPSCSVRWTHRDSVKKCVPRGGTASGPSPSPPVPSLRTCATLHTEGVITLQEVTQGLDINSQENFFLWINVVSRRGGYLMFCLLVYVNLENYSIRSRKVFFGW